MATETPKAITALPEAAAVGGEDYLVMWSGSATMKVLASLFQGAAGATGATGPAGADGADGFSPTVSGSKNGKQTTIIITDRAGAHTFQIMDGADGTVTFDDLTEEQKASLKGDPGVGVPGYTPVRGVDYWTAEDQADIVADVLEQLPDSGDDGGGESEIYTLDLDALGAEWTESTSGDMIRTSISLSDSQAAELDSAIDAGKILRVKATPYNGTHTFNIFLESEFEAGLTSISYRWRSPVMPIGGNMTISPPGGYVSSLLGYNANSKALICLFYYFGNSLPAVTSEDNGKFLRVVDGAWAAEALTDVSQEGQ